MIDKKTWDEIYETGKEYFQQFDILKNPKEGSIQEKAQKCYEELPNVYRKLEEKKLLPEGINLNIFMSVVLPRLEHAANQAQIMKAFGF